MLNCPFLFGRRGQTAIGTSDRFACVSSCSSARQKPLNTRTQNITFHRPVPLITATGQSQTIFTMSKNTSIVLNDGIHFLLAETVLICQLYFAGLRPA
jgi:hypothetical protein